MINGKNNIDLTGWEADRVIRALWRWMSPEQQQAARNDLNKIENIGRSPPVIKSEDVHRDWYQKY